MMSSMCLGNDHWQKYLVKKHQDSHFLAVSLFSCLVLQEHALRADSVYLLCFCKLTPPPLFSGSI